MTYQTYETEVIYAYVGSEANGKGPRSLRTFVTYCGNMVIVPKGRRVLETFKDMLLE